MDSGSGNAQSIRFHPNGLLPNEVASVTGPLDRKRWTRAEENAAKLISCIQPNWASEKHRNAVASYVQRLIANCMPCLQVVTFGSVPLKTYLPDGDIDLTAFSEDQNLKDKWADEVRNMLEKEEKNEGAEFQVKEVQYIQAEVKIIKCLVDNIVVDISFNQLGGLCTLCFLEEVDNVISQNHLFKRSIILIKAWCYYESRILGAHHGLISTYALETLVLYIFHVFNNSFAGPLEVLYRFLEFFSKFDWANYCVSLWGPVPTSSLPHLAAIPPRKDGGELLLNKMFLSCSTAYSVFPGGLENQEQSFLSKHFNIIDPLRINNNLGRSVSKGNFYRIRSAFSLGAQKLARILECQEESIVEEVEQIFMNTWNRHSEGGRPDAPIINVSHLRQVYSVHGRNFKEQASNKKSTEKLVSPDPAVDQAHHSPKSAFDHGNFPLSPTIRNINAPNNYDATTDQEASGWGHCDPWRTYLADEQQNEETCRIGTLQTRGCLMPQFSRTCSSPELANISREAASRRHNVGTEKMEVDGVSTSNINGKTRGSSIIENYVAEYSTDEPHKTENSSHFDIYNAFNPNLFWGSYVGKSVADSTKSVTSSVEQNRSHEEVQNFKNLVSSSGIQKYDGLVQGHVNLASHSLVPISPSILQYSHHDFNGTIRAKLTSLESDCGTIRQYHDGPSPMSVQHTDAVRVRSDREEMIGKLNNRGVLAGVGHQGDRSSLWTDRDTDSIGEIDPVSDKFSTSSSRLSPSSPATLSWTKASSESSWDKKPSTITNLVKSSLGNRTAGSWNPSSIANSGWQVDGDFADQAYYDLDDDCCDWTPLSTGEAVVTSSHAEVHQSPGFRPSQTSYTNSVLSFAPLLLHPGSQQGVTHNHAVLPVAFYPTGPPVPFITMVPVCNVYTETTTPGLSTYQIDLETEKEKSIFPVSQSGGSSDLAMDSELLSHSDSHNSVERSPSGEHSDKVVSDIFLSDFASHWRYLQYGRLCQSSQLQHPFIYPPSVIGAPQHLPEHLPFNAPGKPSPVSADALSHQVPVSAMLPGSGKPVGFTRQFGEVSMYRNGTGTYFPTPKIFRDRQFVTARQYHGDHYHDRNEHHEDKEANWKFNSKTRFTGRAEARHRYEKPNIKMDHSVHSPSQTGHWDTFQNKPNRLQRFSKSQSTSKPARKGFKNVDSSMYWMQSAHHNEVSPSGDSHSHMVCTSAETVSCGSPIEQLQFGSVGPDSFVGVDGVPDLHGGYPIGGNHDKKNYHGGDSG